MSDIEIEEYVTHPKYSFEYRKEFREYSFNLPPFNILTLDNLR